MLLQLLLVALLLPMLHVVLLLLTQKQWLQYRCCVVSRLGRQTAKRAELTHGRFAAMRFVTSLRLSFAGPFWCPPFCCSLSLSRSLTFSFLNRLVFFRVNGERKLNTAAIDQGRPAASSIVIVDVAAKLKLTPHSHMTSLLYS